MMCRSNVLYLLLLLCSGFILLEACKKDTVIPPNPYDQVDYGDTTSADPLLSASSFAGLHQQIFATKCAMPGCHDGHFEPDFRTVQSAYNTLVYHPVVKQLSPWKYRVAPGDTAMSWLWQRINHELIVSGTDTSQGRMPLYANKLSSSELQNISTWIMGGAKDMFGQLPVEPNMEPKATGYLAFDQSLSRIDTQRVGNVFYNPFLAPQGQMISIYVLVEDDQTPVSQLTGNKLKLSLDENDFSSAAVVNGSYTSIGGYDFWVFNLNPSLWPMGSTVFMRYYTNDGDHPADTEFPTNNLIYEYKTYWSFYVS